MIGTAVAGDGQATLTWAPPLGNPLNAAFYIVQPWVGDNPQPSVTFESTETSQVITGLTNGTTYQFYVRAVNSLGHKSGWSEPSNPVTPKAVGSVTIGPPGRTALLDAPDTVTGLAPLVVLLHGYGTTAAIQNNYLGVTAQAATRGTYVLLPNGTPGGLEPATTRQYWNSGMFVPAIPVDDVSYLRDLIAEAIAVSPIDPERIYVFGHSNGGSMAYRLACELSGEVTAIAALAAPQVTGLPCAPTHPTSVLSIHGDLDEVVFYAGGSTLGSSGGVTFPPPPSPYPSAPDQLALWADRLGCDAEPVAAGRLNLSSPLAGDETAVTVHEGCPAGIDAQLDTIEGGTHIPSLIHASVGTAVLDWLLAHTG